MSKPLKEELKVIIDMATGADGCVTYVKMLAFIAQCDREGNDIPFLRQMAELCRRVQGMKLEDLKSAD